MRGVRSVHVFTLMRSAGIHRAISRCQNPSDGELGPSLEHSEVSAGSAQVFKIEGRCIYFDIHKRVSEMT